jgi:conjugal transfer pilus assembly protein TraA
MTESTLQHTHPAGFRLSEKALLRALIFLIALIAVWSAVAGETGTEFEGLYDLLFGWAQGYLGKAFAFAAFIAGIAAGVAKSSPMLGAIGIVFAIVISVGPGIINGILTATI